MLTVSKVYEEIQSCGCMCHKPGFSIMHFAACCSFCYVKTDEVEDFVNYKNSNVENGPNE